MEGVWERSRPQGWGPREASSSNEAGARLSTESGFQTGPPEGPGRGEAQLALPAGRTVVPKPRGKEQRRWSALWKDGEAGTWRTEAEGRGGEGEGSGKRYGQEQKARGRKKGREFSGVRALGLSTAALWGRGRH